MKRSSPLKRSPMRRRSRALTTQERRAYRDVTELSREPEGYLVCSHCGRSITDGEEQRHHIVFRSQGGRTIHTNIRILCGNCHEAIHSHAFYVPVR